MNRPINKREQELDKYMANVLSNLVLDYECNSDSKELQKELNVVFNTRMLSTYPILKKGQEWKEIKKGENTIRVLQRQCIKLHNGRLKRMGLYNEFIFPKKEYSFYNYRWNDENYKKKEYEIATKYFFDKNTNKYRNLIKADDFFDRYGIMYELMDKTGEAGEHELNNDMLECLMYYSGGESIRNNKLHSPNYSYSEIVELYEFIDENRNVHDMFKSYNDFDDDRNKIFQHAMRVAKQDVMGYIDFVITMRKRKILNDIVDTSRITGSLLPIGFKL